MEWEDVYDQGTWERVTEQFNKVNACRGVSKIISVELTRNIHTSNRYDAEVDYMDGSGRNCLDYYVTMYSSTTDMYNPMENLIHELLDKAFQFYGIRVITGEGDYFKYRDNLDTDIGKLIISLSGGCYDTKLVEISYQTRFYSDWR